jgi:putative transposase
MARALRLEFSGALYHLTSRGNRREDIYEDDLDRAAFLELFGEVCKRYQWDCHAYCLMNNHYHLLVETYEGNLSQGMRQLNGVYSLRYNGRHTKVGHVFQGRYKAILVEKEAYLLELSRYIVLNPVRAGMVRYSQDWPWSSYRATLSQAPKPDWLNLDWLLSCFHSNQKTAQLSYTEFVEAGNGLRGPWGDLKNQIFLGSENFVKERLGLLDCDQALSNIPRLQKRIPAQTLKSYGDAAPSRNAGIIEAYKSGGYTQKAIGGYFGVTHSMVSKIINAEGISK